MVRGLVAFALCALLLAPPAGGGASTLERELLREVNRARAERGRAPLRLDPLLQRAARAHSADMLRRGYFSHRDFDSRMKRSGADGPYIGENLAWASAGTAAAEKVVRMWLKSPGHRANLLRRGYQRIGVAAPTGTFRGHDGAIVVTAVFAGS